MNRLPEIPLPIAERKGRKPSFTLEDLLVNEPKTKRADCTFEAIQQVMQKEVLQYRIPADLAISLSRLQRWQLVVPTTFDVAQLLFLGKMSDDRDYLPISEAEATVFIHRGAEGGDWSKPRGKYMTTWIELAGIFPDSNDNQRIVGIFYNCSTPSGEDRELNEGHGRLNATGLKVSIANDEYTRKLTVMDNFIPAIDTIPTRIRVPQPGGLITQGMIDSLPEPHHRVLQLHPNPTFYLHQIGGKDEEIDFDQGISLQIKDREVEVGLVSPLGNRKPWTISIPETLEKS